MERGMFLMFMLLLFGHTRAKSGLDICERKPIHTNAHRSRGDNGFRIKILDIPETLKYRPGEVYTIELNGTYPEQSFLGFMLVAVPEGASHHEEKTTMGNFLVEPNSPVRKAPHCHKTVIMHHFLMAKHGVTMRWQAPEAGSGCVELRATVIELSDIWYKDDGGLSTVICEDTAFSATQGDGTGIHGDSGCCACGHAMYRMTFKGLWSRQTHPKDFPTGRDALTLHWSNIVGASHSDNYRIWEYGQHATRGVKEVCEYGYSTKLEKDMKHNSAEIRTVIKTNPMWKNVQGTREAVFTVNQKSHLLSLLTMMGPSPDWCVGVSSVNLCQTNCSWADDLEIPLFPWDAGTDSGVKYISRNIETDPTERIHEISNTYPNHRDSPFYGRDPIKPVAVLMLHKTKEDCSSDHDSSNSEEQSPSSEDLIQHMMERMMEKKKLAKEKCAVSEWTDWTECDNPCGGGMRLRSRMLKNPMVTEDMCGLQLMEKESCMGKCMENTMEKPDRNSMKKPEGKEISDEFVVRHEIIRDPNDICAVTPWSDWSPCSVTCGIGMKERWRMFLRKTEHIADCGLHIMEKDLCSGLIPDCRKAMMMMNFTALCQSPKEVGPCKGSFMRWYYDTDMKKCLTFLYGGCRGNENKFDTEKDCRRHCQDHMAEIEQSNPRNAELVDMSQALKEMMMKKHDENSNLQLDSSTPGNDVAVMMTRKKKRMLKKRKKAMLMARRNRVPCMVTPWSDWSECSVTCGKGVIVKTRMIKVHPEKGGKNCPKKMAKKKKCKLPKCAIDCMLGDWGFWTPCSKTCGDKAVQVRRKEILQKPKWGGMPCPAKREKRFCTLPMCPKDQGSESFMAKKMMSHPSL